MTLSLLNVRLWLGWWRHPVELRATSAHYLRMLREGIIMALVFLALSVLLFHLAHPRSVPLLLTPELLRLLVSVGGYLAALFSCFLLLPGITMRLLAHRGERGGESTVYGCCFAVLLDPPSHFFARIGLTHETARWYSLPLDWDMVFEPSEAEFELTVLSGTGWVERLRRLGPASRVLTQPVPQPLSRAGTSAASQAVDNESAGNDNNGDGELKDEPEGATAEEKQILRRFARRADLSWRASPAKIASMGWACVVTGLLLFPGLPAYVALLVLLVYPLNLRNMNDPASRVAVIVSLAVLFILCMIFIAMGLRHLRIWQRVRRVRHELPASVRGEVTCWIPYKDMWSPNDGQNRRETLVSLRLPDRETHIFRIPIRYMHRVRKRGALVRITYLPTTERVQGVAYVEAPAQVTARDSSHAN